MAQDHGLSWGALNFTGSGAVDPNGGWAIEAMADGTNVGNPQALIEVVKSLLTDGSLAVLEGWDNREAPIRLRLSAPDAVAGPALAEAERALMAQILEEQKDPLVWIPPAQDAATCVFDVVAAKLERDVSDDWDYEEAKREYRYYLLTLTCLPFARTETSTVAEALPVPPGDPVDPDPPETVLIDECDSSTGWTGQGTDIVAGPGVSDEPSAVRLVGDVASASDYLRMTRTGAVAMGSTPYLVIDTEWTTTEWADGSSRTPAAGKWVVKIDGVVQTLTSVEVGAGEGGSTRITIIPPTSFNTVSVEWDITAINRTRRMRLRVWKIQRVSIQGDTTSSTTRQQSRTVAVSGSAPTQATIRFYEDTPGTLGEDVLVYTSRDLNWQPPLRSWIDTSMTVTADEAMISGGRQTLASPTVYLIPASLLAVGTYALMGRLNVTTTGTLSWQARMVAADGSDTIGSSVITTGSTSLASTTGYQVLDLGVLALPVVAADADQMVELTLSGTANMTLDEAWLFNLTDGALTWVRNPDIEWIEIRSPELGAARPSVYGGTGTHGENAVCIDWACESFGAHRFDPGLMQVFTIASSSLVSQSELEFYPRYHSHVDGSAA